MYAFVCWNACSAPLLHTCNPRPHPAPIHSRTVLHLPSQHPLLRTDLPPVLSGLGLTRMEQVLEGLKANGKELERFERGEASRVECRPVCYCCLGTAAWRSTAVS